MKSLFLSFFSSMVPWAFFLAGWQLLLVNLVVYLLSPNTLGLLFAVSSGIWLFVGSARRVAAWKRRERFFLLLPLLAGTLVLAFGLREVYRLLLDASVLTLTPSQEVLQGTLMLGTAMLLMLTLLVPKFRKWLAS